MEALRHIFIVTMRRTSPCSEYALIQSSPPVNEAYKRQICVCLRREIACKHTVYRCQPSTYEPCQEVFGCGDDSGFLYVFYDQCSYGSSQGSRVACVMRRREPHNCDRAPSLQSDTVDPQTLKVSGGLQYVECSVVRRTYGQCMHSQTHSLLFVFYRKKIPSEHWDRRSTRSVAVVISAYMRNKIWW